jgi:hypothetical protein
MIEDNIRAAVERSRKGVQQYLAIMDALPTVNVATDRDFQRQYNTFYRVRQKPARWYSTYFHYLQACKSEPATFEQVLDYLHSQLSSYEASFASKLAATLNPREPIWDKFVLQNTGHRSPPYGCEDRLARIKAVYASLRTWYANKLAAEDGRLIVAVFNEMVPEHNRISDLKKVDFVLWQIR